MSYAEHPFEMEPMLPQFYPHPDTGKPIPIDYDPSEQIDLEKEIRWNPEMEMAFQYNATHLVPYYIRRNMGRDSFVVIQTAGYSGSGKSYLSWAIAFWVQDYLRKMTGNPDICKIHLVWNWSELNRKIQETTEYDIVICDEEVVMTGQGSYRDRVGLFNILESCRAKKVSFFFNSPDPKPKPNVHFVLRVIGLVRPIWHTLAIFYTRSGSPVGVVDWDIPRTPETKAIFKWYEKEKQKNIDRLFQMRGGTDPNIGEIQWRQAQNLYRYCKKRIPEGDRWTKATVESLLTDLPGLAGEVGDHKKQVVEKMFLVKKQMERKQEIQGKSQIDKELSVKWDLKLLREEDLPEEMLDQLEPYLYEAAEQHNAVAQKGDIVPRYMCETWLRWAKGETQNELANFVADNKPDKDDVSQALVSKYVRRVGRNVSGYAVEYWLKDYELKPKDGWEHGGMATRAPDFINHNKKQVVSAKSRTEKSTHIDWRDFGKQERAAAIDKDYDLLMYYFELKYQKIRRTYILNPVET